MYGKDQRLTSAVSLGSLHTAFVHFAEDYPIRVSVFDVYVTVSDVLVCLSVEWV